MDESGVRLWIDKVWGKRPGELGRRKSLLVWDAFRVHLTDVPKTILREDHDTDIAVIPGGLTSVVQPLDVCLNMPFKGHLRVKWTQWMLEGEKTYTVVGNMRAASLETVCQWVKESWEEICEMVRYSFDQCGISNALYGHDDDVLWRDVDGKAGDVDNGADSEVADEMDDVDVYDDMLNLDEMEDLFGESDDDDPEGDLFDDTDEDNRNIFNIYKAFNSSCIYSFYDIYLNNKIKFCED